MNKFIVSISVLFILFGCSIKQESNLISKNVSIMFAPVADEKEIINEFPVLKQLLSEELFKHGYQINRFDFQVAVSAQAAAEALASGTTLMAYINPTTFLLYENDGLKPMLNGTRFNLNVDSFNPDDWNFSFPLKIEEKKDVGYFYSMIIAGPSKKGLAIKDNYIKSGKANWEILNSATICIGKNPTQTTSYIYPSIWLTENYGKTINDLSNPFPSTNSVDVLANLASESCDIGFASAASMIDSSEKWTNSWGRKSEIWSDIYILGVTKRIENSLFAISKNSLDYDVDFENSLTSSFIEISKTTEGKKFLDIFNLNGVQIPSETYLESSRIALNYLTNLGN